MGKPNPSDAARSNRIIRVVLTVMLAVSMIPATGVQSAFADEPAERPAVTGGDAALMGFGGNDASASAGTPVAAQREDGTLAANGLVYVATDGGLMLVGFDGLAEGEDAVEEVVVPAAISVDGEDTSVVAVDVAEGNVAESIVALTLPQSVNNVNTATLASAFPNLAAIEIAAPKASAPVAAGAAAIRAAYSSFGGVLYRNAWVATDGDASQTTLMKELIWAPSATVVARIPVECTSIAPGAFADVKDLKTLVCFGVMESIPQAQKADDGTVTPGAFTDEQIQTVNVIVPQTGTVVPNGDHVSADVAVTDVSTMDVKREAWWKFGFASDRITLGEVYGSTTNALPVNDEGVLETAEAEVAYAPETTQNSSSRKAGIEPPESAIPTPVPDDDELDPSESGLVFTHLADMTLSVSWKGDPTATPSHIDTPAYATINGVTYPVTEIAPEAFKGAVFLTSVAIPETVKTIGEGAFEGCVNLSDSDFLFALKETSDATSTGALVPDESGTDHPALFQSPQAEDPISGAPADERIISPYAINGGEIALSCSHSLKDCVSVRWGGSSLTLDDSTSQAFSSGWTQPFEHTNSWLNGAGFGMHFETLSSTGVRTGNSKILNIEALDGYKVVGASVLWGGAGTPALPLSMYVQIGVIKTGASHADKLGLLRTIDGDSRYALSGHNHNGVYAGIGIIGSGGKLTDSGFSTVDSGLSALKEGLAGAETELEEIYRKGAFNTISYNLDGGEEGAPLPTFYVNDAEKLPTVPEPQRGGYEFKGWTWGGQASPVKDPKAAFTAGGPVTLTAHWEEAEPETPEATHFFTGERPLRHGDASERQTHVIKVRLSNTPRTLASVLFEGDDRTHLLKDTSGVELYVGAGEDAIASGTRLPWGGSTGSGWTCALAKLSDDSYGVYVGISVPTTAIDEASVPVSYTDGSYVASLVKMNYVFA